METLLENISRFRLDQWRLQFESLISQRQTFLDTTRGNFHRFSKVVEQMPDIAPSTIDLDSRAVTIGASQDLTQNQKDEFDQLLLQLRPWRKGPFDFFGIPVDSEWQSWMKWDRFKDQIGSLKGKRILDIGSSNGYYMFRMAAQKPLMILGIEPQSSFYYQYRAAQKYLKLDTVFCLPVPFKDLPVMDSYFDRVFCMGILYHRKSPVQMLKDIFLMLRPGGMLVLENLVLDARRNLCLFPKDRYAKMRNVFFIPDLLAMESWLMRAGFKDICCVDVTPTRALEQRKTRWIETETLVDFLDPSDPSLTVEGYPAPVRAVFTARVPGA